MNTKTNNKEVEDCRPSPCSTYLDYLRDTVNSYCEYKNQSVNPDDLKISKLKELHSKIWELRSPEKTFQEMIDDWNERVPTIPWELR